jgi:hypothetical protein
MGASMDGPTFDLWTRRRVGLSAGSAVATLLGWTNAAKSRRRKKRCKQVGVVCKPGSTRKCCRSLLCQEIADLSGTRCCRKEGARCGGNGECCEPLTCGNHGDGKNRCLPPFSDRQLKANIASVDPTDVLRRVQALPVATWNDSADDPSIRHIGPMAQDFAAVFGVGADDRHIHPIDGQGVVLAAVQGLVLELERLQRENDVLAARVAVLETGATVSRR